jgi:hypothetical protein
MIGGDFLDWVKVYSLGERELREHRVSKRVLLQPQGELFGRGD